MRVFMVGNLGNFYGDTRQLAAVMKEAEEFQHDLSNAHPLDLFSASRVASAYAEHVWHNWDWPKHYDLVIWEVLDADESDGLNPTQVFRVQIPVRFVPEFWDTEESTLQVPTPEAAS